MQLNTDDQRQKRREIEADLRRIEQWLPHQGPIDVFIHRNTLSAFEDQSFCDAVEATSIVRGAEPYMPHAWYIKRVKAGRIALSDCEEPLTEFESRAPDVGLKGIFAASVRRAALSIPRLVTSDEVIRSVLEVELDASQAGDSQALWAAVRGAVNSHCRVEKIAYTSARSHVQTLDPTDRALVQLSAAFIDTGIAFWPMPRRDIGFFNAVKSVLLRADIAAQGPWRWFGPEAKRIILAHPDAVAVIEAIVFQDPEARLDSFEFLRREALALPGWAGAFATLGHGGGGRQVRSNLAEFLAIRLLLKISRERGTGKGPGENPLLASATKGLWLVREMYLVLAALGVTAEKAESWSADDWRELDDSLAAFGDVPRRRCLQHAYERRYLRQVLAAIGSGHDGGARHAPSLQAIFCIDEREESLRRHLEETDPTTETFGAAGFFGIDMLFRGVNESAAVPLCPPVIQPNRVVIEYRDGGRREPSLALGKFIHESSRKIISGALLAQAAGMATALPLALRVLLPGLGGKHVRGPSQTGLEFEFTGRVTEEGVQIGFAVGEMADRVEGVLRGIGLLKGFAPLVFVVGHGSQSLNNPHESAHDCGACGGRRGAANARVFARMANHPDVRGELNHRGIAVPADTWFVGAYHDTCSDQLDFSDVQLIPVGLRSRYDAAKAAFDRARALNAAERCRRFSRGSRGPPAKALSHVMTRCADLRQPRPEYGHASNAALIVGRRELTRGVFLDRRSFLVSYDPATDAEGQILGRLLGAVIPVCAGISLEYYFSFVDNEKYGCGTKLPHNVVGLFGVMNGATSDLRTGLPLQMVEIHEPMRLAVVVESTTEVLSKLLALHPSIARLVDNEWIQLHVFDGASKAFFRRAQRQWQTFDIEATKLPRVAQSLAYANGRSDHLSPVVVAGET